MPLKSAINWLVTPPKNGSADKDAALRDGSVSGQAGRAALNILVCNFDGPDGRKVAYRLADFLKGKPRVQVQTISRKLKLPDRGGIVEKLVAAAETGRKWLAGSSCDVLLWGKTAGPEKNITIRFLCATGDADMQAGSFGLGDALEVDPNYNVDLENVIFAATVAAVAPRKPDPVREELAKILADASNSLSALIDAPPSDVEQAQFTSLMTFLGTIYAALWRVGGVSDHLDLAIRAYRAVLSQEYDPDDPMAYALAQNHMATALQALSKRDNKPEPLKLAAGCYRSVAAALGAHSHANDWALAHIHLGDVLVKLSKLQDQEANLKGASAAYQAASKIFTRHTMPGAWAELMNQLGVTLMELSGITNENRTLDQAASCFRQALEIRRRDAAPLLWAQSANNLGAATFSIYRQSKNKGLLNEAASCFEGAAAVYAAHNRDNTARVARKNLERIRQLQEE